MKFVGSKNNISKELAPIIQSYITEDTVGYLECCVGGCNMIDKIQHENKIGYDIHKELIALLNYVKDKNNKLPKSISEDEYTSVRDNKNDYPEWYVGLVGFCATFGAKYFGGYARSFKADKVTPRNMPAEAIRNIEKQREKLKDITFKCKDFRDIKCDEFQGFVIYADIPYRGTTKYSTNEFPYEEFYSWAKRMNKNNVVLISEYEMPDEFECIWSKNVSVNIDSKKVSGENRNRVEKLFKPIK